MTSAFIVAIVFFVALHITMSISKSFSFLLFVYAIAFLLVFPWALQDGMFCDGILYSTVSKNLADGYGSFWNLPGSCEGINSFHEQPPLVFFMQSFFFKIFTNSIYAERIYCILMLVISMLLMNALWKEYFRNTAYERQGFAGALFYIICPVTYWSYVNNVIECTMVNFILAAVLLLVRYFRGRSLINLAIAGVLILGASLCKGIQGTFVITGPFLFWLVFRKQSFAKMLLESLLLVLPLVLFYSTAFLVDEIRNSFLVYFDGRFTATFAGRHDTVAYRIYLLWDLLQILLPAIGIVSVMVFFARRTMNWVPDKDVVFFLLISAAGILPLMATKEQRTFYMVSGLPYLAMAMGAYIRKPIRFWIEKITDRQSRLIAVFSAVLLCGVVVFGISIAGTPKRDKELLLDVYTNGPVIGTNYIVGCNATVYNDWSVPNYFNRYFHICMVSGKMAEGKEWYIVRNSETLPAGYTEVKQGAYLKLGRLIRSSE